MTAARSDLMALKPCPFCGGNDLTLTVNRHGWKIVECDNCGMRGPCIDLEGDEYLNRWNTRAASRPDRSSINQAMKENLVAGLDATGTPIISGFNSAANAILSLLSGAGSGADTKSDGRTRDSLSSEENEPVVTRACGPSDPSPGHEVKPAPIADSSEAGRGGSQALREVVVKYLHDGRLQTFEDRERFRKEARAALSAPVGEPNRYDRIIHWLKKYQADEYLDDGACEELDALISVLERERAYPPAPAVGHIGWLYFNPDAGTEFNEQHPVESGQCEDAENIRPATAETLRDELLDTWRDRERNDQVVNAAIEFLIAAKDLTGLSKMRVNGKMMDAQDVAAELSGCELGRKAPAVGADVREALETIASNDGNADQAVAKRALELIDNLSALTRPLGGFVQGSIARKQSTDTEGSSRTETAGGAG